MEIKSLSGITLTAKNFEAMITFYRDILGISLESETLDEFEVYYWADLGLLHFEIHPWLLEESPQNTEIKLQFEVDSLEGYLERLEERGFSILTDVHSEIHGLAASVLDPDGNKVELIKLRHEIKN